MPFGLVLAPAYAWTAVPGEAGWSWGLGQGKDAWQRLHGHTGGSEGGGQYGWLGKKAAHMATRVGSPITLPV